MRGTIRPARPGCPPTLDQPVLVSTTEDPYDEYGPEWPVPSPPQLSTRYADGSSVAAGGGLVTPPGFEYQVLAALGTTGANPYLVDGVARRFTRVRVWTDTLAGVEVPLPANHFANPQTAVLAGLQVSGIPAGMVYLNEAPESPVLDPETGSAVYGPDGLELWSGAPDAAVLDSWVDTGSWLAVPVCTLFEYDERGIWVSEDGQTSKDVLRSMRFVSRVWMVFYRYVGGPPESVWSVPPPGRFRSRDDGLVAGGFRVHRSSRQLSVRQRGYL